MSEWLPATATELSRLVGENFRGKQNPLSPVGGRTALHYGGQLAVNSEKPLTLISLTELDQVIDYPARDMTITVEAGIRVEKLIDVLTSEHQRLPIDIPQSHRATLGGVIACDVSGPSRYGYGTFRDYLIGMSAVDGQGRLFSAGGRVVKNVAGYDLCKLMIGSLGTLGTLTQITLKTRPVAATRGFVWAIFSDLSQIDKTLEFLNRSQTRPVILDVLNPKAVWQIQAGKHPLPADRFALCIGFEGTQAEVDWQVKTVLQELEKFSPESALSIEADKAEHLWKSLTDYQAASDDPVSFQATVPPSKTLEFIALAGNLGIAVQAHVGNGIIIGHLADRCADAATARQIIQPLRHFAELAHGALTIISADVEWGTSLDHFGTRTAAWDQMRKLKTTLDPANLFNPGKLFSK